MQEGKLSLESKDIVAEKRQELLRLFPETQTEGGRIDFDQLKRVLGESVDTGRERYGMNWPGKADCFRLIQSPSTATLLPVREESVRFDESENLIIEGDNLEVLKLLQKGYQNKVKMIYIDPPYNTGNDFIYPDDFVDNLKNYLQYTGQVDAEGKRFSTNLDSDGRFHSKWLNMLYPRLYLARNLLCEDGVIFISCDENELKNLIQLMDAVFGESTALGTLTVLCNPKGRSQDKYFATNHEYIVVYGRSILPKGALAIEKKDDQVEAEYGEEDEGGKYRLLELRNTHREFGQHNRPNLWYPIYVDEVGAVSTEMTHGAIEVHPLWDDGFRGCWTWGLEKAENESELLVAKEVKGKWKIFRKSYASGAERMLKSILSESDFYTESGQRDFAALFGSKEKIFQSPKATGLLKTLMETSLKDGDLVLDFFAGSGTTGHAALRLSEEERIDASFILVQLPEPTGRDDYKSISDITKERVRRVIQTHEKQSEGKLDLQQKGQSRRKGGFRVFRLAPSNFKVWDAHTDEGLEGVERQMELAVNHIMPDRTSEDLFYEILMKSEYPLTAKVENFDASGITAFSVEDDALIVCVERKVTAEAVTAIAKRSPSKVIFLDEAFGGNDQLKANAKMNFESAGVKRFETV